ncbi:MAG: type II toxin-antitoxin system VapC family toxin [Alphaproteobacteria bacterium]|nr:type II toxin-antitoxin system VapC family toxin [Alphaproteobacteria bacterium]MBU0803106.1 type II toxin-antitoxin system VapC family toxin [Alphaproteobacteria bacterium]MBU0873794.1 type II toxin-antitoxin system VapC family toxin [Alphaproteobacteria bacterium]MBU1400706.1 type II toxin-antitoxin system VapC family toxin [Alphaproteobacteria bacterium]MBU1590579.1 type II toxin-antitoxin system VapC family toxin [Alphaproteobacteria bacterium]
MSAVMDASAIMAIANDEPGGDFVRRRLAGSKMSLVNAIEVGTKLMDKGFSSDEAWGALELLDITLVDLDAELATAAIALREQTREKGLSLADRTCLALAIREGLSAVTADRAWATLNLPCKIELIR